jgi:dephospho-CoA kinase
MVVVGLTGGIATGKSAVAQMFAQCGAAVLNADEMVRELQMPGTAVYEAIVKAFGRSILHGDGTIDRKALGDLVFREAQVRRRLEAIVHPALVATVQRRVADLRTQGVPVCIVELPLLIEAAGEGRYDSVVVVTAPEGVQVKRLMAARGLTREEALARIRSQMPLEMKERRADFVIENGEELGQAERHVREIYALLLRKGRKKT